MLTIINVNVSKIIKAELPLLATKPKQTDEKSLLVVGSFNLKLLQCLFPMHPRHSPGYFYH